MRMLHQYQFSEAMERLIKNSDFQLLRSRWLQLRFDIEEVGKDKKRPEDWAELKGFDAAVMEPEKFLKLQGEKPPRREQPIVPTEDLDL